MTEQKKEFIADALGEISDDFVAEAVEYQKAKFTWKYTRELVTVAACAAVLLLSANALRLIPIVNKGSETSAVAPETMKEEMAVETADAVEKSEAKPENEENSIEGTLVSDQYGEKEKQDQIVNNTEYIYQKIGEEELKETLYSRGIEWRRLTPAETDAEKEICGYPTLESVQTMSCVRWMSPEEILALDIDIFMGTVTDMETYHVSGGMEKYFTIATVKVEDSIRSELETGDTCRIYLPFARIGGLATTTSIVGDLEKLEIGSKAIFMPYKATEETGEASGDAWLSYLDFSDYYFGEGMRFLFLETENGISYATDVYDVSVGEEVGLEEIAEYLRGILDK